MWEVLESITLHNHLAFAWLYIVNILYLCTECHQIKIIPRKEKQRLLLKKLIPVLRVAVAHSTFFLSLSFQHIGLNSPWNKNRLLKWRKMLVFFRTLKIKYLKICWIIWINSIIMFFIKLYLYCPSRILLPFSLKITAFTS